jgi:hypothetical protein
MTKLLTWLDAIGYLKLLGTYCAAIMIVAVLSFLLAFPLIFIYPLFGLEFSNLGPIATLFYGILFDMFVVTPAFLILFIAKIFRRCRR